MANKILYGILFLLFQNWATVVLSQDIPAKNWDVEKIRGTRFLPYRLLLGFPFLTETWVLGQIELENGTVIDNLNLRYSSFKDDLIYYNQNAAAQIVIDKASLKGFSYLGTDGKPHVFIKLRYDNPAMSERFFEVLSEGNTKLLAYRKVSMDNVSPYKSEDDIIKNMIYNLDYSYCFYSPEKGFNWVRLNGVAFLAKFDKLSQKPIKRLLRKNRIRITDETSLVQGWKVVEQEGFQVVF